MINSGYHQIATYWDTPVSNGFGGYTFENPKVINVRWEERQDEFLDAKGDKRISRAIVFISEELTLGGYLMLGDHSDLGPTALDDSWQIKKLTVIPDIRNAVNERRAFL